MMTPVRILLVEDNPRVRQLLADAIERETPHEVVASADEAGTALRRVGQMMPDLVIASLDLANGTGFQVLAASRVFPPGPVLIALSNNGGSEFRERALTSGAHHFFDKSLEFDAFLSLLQTLPRESQTPTPTELGAGK